MTDSRSFLPPSGNPVRPILIILAVFFTLMLIAFSIGMPLLSMGAGTTILLAVIIIATAALCIGFTWRYGESFERERLAMVSGEAWARWELSPAEHQRFAGGWSKDARQNAAIAAVFGIGMGVFFLTVGDDRLTGSIMLGVFAIAALIALLVGRPPSAARQETLREVVIGPDGVMVGGRYLPLRATGVHLEDVRLEIKEAPMLHFVVRSGIGPKARVNSRIETIDVPIPLERLTEAERLIERFRLET
jgi:hypothetical protein